MMTATRAQPQGADRRRSPRLPSTVPVEVFWTDENGSPIKQPGETECVNAHGALVCTKPHFPVPLEVNVLSILSGQASKARLVGFREPDTRGRLRMALELHAPSYDFWGAAYQPVS